MSSPSLLLPAASSRTRSSALAALAAFATLLAVSVATLAAGSPDLIARTGMRSDLANSIVRVVETLGAVPWWALVIIGGGLAGALVGIIRRYGLRYAVNW